MGKGEQETQGIKEKGGGREGRDGMKEEGKICVQKIQSNLQTIN